MDILEDLLPIIFFGIALLTKIKKGTNQNTEKHSRDKTIKRDALEQARKRVGRHTITKAVKKQPAEEDNKLKQTPIHKESNGAAMDYEIEDEIILERYINNEREKFVKQISTPGIEINNEIKDAIKEKEIGSSKLHFSRKRLVESIIMSEILEKPKALRR
ncbi:MAG: hypothetical protein ACOYVK_01895 [Bacillota bacterium]